MKSALDKIKNADKIRPSFPRGHVRVNLREGAREGNGTCKTDLDDVICRSLSPERGTKEERSSLKTWQRTDQCGKSASEGRELERNASRTEKKMEARKETFDSI